MRPAPLRGGARGDAAARGRPAARADRWQARPSGRPVRTRRARRARGARGRRLGHLHAAAEAVARAPRPRGGARARAMSTDAAYGEVLRITRREAKNFAYGISARRLD